MKKVIAILVLVILIASYVSAQDFKPVAGNVAVEVNFTPLSAAPIGLNYLKMRYFIANDLVFRLGVDIRMHSAKSEPVNFNNPNLNDEVKMSYSQFGVFPGFEKHFGNWERFSPYIGTEIGFTIKGAKSEYTDNDAKQTYETKGAWDDNGSQRGFMAINFNALCGADFYFTKKIYLGAEIGFGVLTTSLKEVEQSVGTNSEVVMEKESVMDVGFNFNPAIRLGFCF
ncbi:MAG: hypothetical protein K8S16_21390 [Bacteroidales bacterium]|nr:hypothetical protein [Bacteroidales bacterium]